jgi:hypothetical protein
MEMVPAAQWLGSRGDILDEIRWQKLDLLVRRGSELGSGIAQIAMESGAIP